MVVHALLRQSLNSVILLKYKKNINKLKTRQGNKSVQCWRVGDMKRRGRQGGAGFGPLTAWTWYDASVA